MPRDPRQPLLAIAVKDSELGATTLVPFRWLAMGEVALVGSHDCDVVLDSPLVAAEALVLHRADHSAFGVRAFAPGITSDGGQPAPIVGRDALEDPMRGPYLRLNVDGGRVRVAGFELAIRSVAAAPVVPSGSRVKQGLPFWARPPAELPVLAAATMRERLMTWLDPHWPTSAPPSPSLDALLAEHRARLLAWSGIATPEPARAAVHHDWAELGRAFARAWLPLAASVPSTPDALPAYVRALVATRAGVGPVGRDPTGQWISKVASRAAADGGLGESLGTFLYWASCHRTLQTLLEDELAFLAAHSDRAGSSPWAPLIMIWAAGVWPMALPEGAFLAFTTHPGQRQTVGRAADPLPEALEALDGLFQQMGPVVLRRSRT